MQEEPRHPQGKTHNEVAQALSALLTHQLSRSSLMDPLTVAPDVALALHWRGFLSFMSGHTQIAMPLLEVDK